MRFSPADLSSWGTRRPPPDNSRSFSGTAQPPYAGPSPLWVQTQRMWLLWCWLWLFQIKPDELYSFHHRLNQVKDAKWLQHYLRWFLRHIQDGGMSCSPKTKRVRNVTKSVSKNEVQPTHHYQWCTSQYSCCLRGPRDGGGCSPDGPGPRDSPRLCASEPAERNSPSEH